jgi:hypothetical protein
MTQNEMVPKATQPPTPETKAGTGCCSAVEQTTCCEPNQKAGCCGQQTAMAKPTGRCGCK